MLTSFRQVRAVRKLRMLRASSWENRGSEAKSCTYEFPRNVCKVKFQFMTQCLIITMVTCILVFSPQKETFEMILMSFQKKFSCNKNCLLSAIPACYNACCGIQTKKHLAPFSRPGSNKNYWVNICWRQKQSEVIEWHKAHENRRCTDSPKFLYWRGCKHWARGLILEFPFPHLSNRAWYLTGQMIINSIRDQLTSV